VPLPWEGDAPSYGFGPGPASWLPQPSEWANYTVATQRDDPHSTYHLYREALRLRRGRGLGGSGLRWVDLGPEVVAFTSGDTLVVANLGCGAVPLPEAAALLIASSGQHSTAGLSETDVPAGVTVWAALTPGRP
jgi:alpha-glucosidase